MIPVSPLFPLLLLSLSLERHAPVTKNTFHSEYDYIIVGAGSAGSVLARRLTELSCVKVLLLEAGPSPPILTEVPGLSGAFESSNISWNYASTPQNGTASALRNKQVPLPAGKTLGGSSTINGMLFSRGNRRNYDEWEALGAVGWSYKEVFPYFLKLEDNEDNKFLRNGYHGKDGPMTISKPMYQSEMKQPLIEAALKLGYEFVDPNGPIQEGFYDHQSTIRHGRRCSTAKAYLIPSENRPNLDILQNAFVTKVEFRGKRATGVKFEFGNATHFVAASREVILSAGSIGSAKLLMLSGIGPRNELEKFQIPVIADLPVGRNLQDHYGNFVAYEMSSSKQPPLSVKMTNDKNIRDFIIQKSGPLASTWGVTLMAFLSNSNSSDADSPPDHGISFIEIDPRFAKQRGIKDEVYDKVLKEHENKPLVMCRSEILQPKSRGSVSLQSTDPEEYPLINPRYFEDERDFKIVVEGLKQCRTIMSSAPLSALGAKEIKLNYPGCENIKDQQSFLECTTRSMIISSSHLSGTAKMGDSRDPTTVVDPELRVKTVSGLRVVDASVMPKIVWGNTNVPVIMIGEKASDIIKKTISCY